jgi:methionyl-tRNA synthetase
MTGADEHGQKIAETAQRQGATPMELCDQYVAKFKARPAVRCALRGMR